MQPWPPLAHGDRQAAELRPGLAPAAAVASWMSSGVLVPFGVLLVLSVCVFPLLGLSLSLSAFLWPSLLDTPLRQSQEPLTPLSGPPSPCSSQ